MNNPRVTIAMTVQGNTPNLGECIDSILSQSIADFELLIVDEGLTEESHAVIECYNDPRIRIIRGSDNHIANLNKLLSESRGCYIALTDSETIMHTDRLRIQADYLDAHPEIGGVCSSVQIIDRNGNPSGSYSLDEEETEITLRMMAEDNAVFNSSAMIRRSCIVNSSLSYNQNYPHAVEYDFWIRFVEAGNRMLSLPFQLIKYRHISNLKNIINNKEITETTRKLKENLINRLIECSNPGYKDPEIPCTGNKLTLIIIFLNEGDEVENTVRSFLSFAKGKVDVIVINDGSYDGYPYMQRLEAIEGVTYILNKERLGTAGSRNKGVELCKTPYFLLLDAHMRAYNDHWVTEIPKCLDENNKRYVCCQTRFLTKNKDGEIVEPPGPPYTFGARMTFRNDSLVPGIQWVNEERKPGELKEQIQCVLGACYAMARDYWLHIGGMNGIRLYGCEEQFVSLKVWLNGGECILLKNIVLGHIYREVMPYSLLPETMMTNALFISESLFPIKERCKARAAAYSISREKYFSSIEYLKTELAETIRELQGSNKFNRELFPDIVNWNRLGTKLDRQLMEDIEARLPIIADYITKQKPSNAGLFDGSLGFAVWLYLYYAHTGDKTVLPYAKKFLDETFNNADSSDFSFSSGITGIGWGLKLLSQNIHEVIESEKVLDQTNKYDNLILSYVKDLEISDASDFSLATGLSGILAYFCFKLPGMDYSEIVDKLDTIAVRLLEKTSSSVSDLFYAFFLLQQKIENNTGKSPICKFLISDWAKPSMFVPKESRFWKPSLYNGVLASGSLCFNLTT